jgi:hypothetical protein
MAAIVMTLVLALTTAQETRQEKPRIPDDSIELTVVGCLTGRVLKTIEHRQTEVESGPYVGARTFRLAGKKDVMKEVKKHDRHLVEVVGIVRRSDLDDKGVTIGGVTVSGASPMSGRIPSPASNVAVMDAESVRLRSSSCSAGQ